MFLRLHASNIDIIDMVLLRDHGCLFPPLLLFLYFEDDQAAKNGEVLW